MIPNTATGLLRHLQRFYSDQHISKDMDAVLLACRTEASKELVSKYARERRKAEGYKPGNFNRNNHDRIPVGVRRAMTKRAEQIHVKEFDVGKKTCLVCRTKWTPKRRDALVCSEACRKRGRRAKAAILNQRCMHKNWLGDCPESWCRNRVDDMSNSAFIRPPEAVQDNA